MAYSHAGGTSGANRIGQFLSIAARNTPHHWYCRETPDRTVL